MPQLLHYERLEAEYCRAAGRQLDRSSAASTAPMVNRLNHSWRGQLGGRGPKYELGVAHQLTNWASGKHEIQGGDRFALANLHRDD